MMKLTLMGSGSGTNIENLLRQFKDHPEIRIDQVITDQVDAGLIKRAAPYLEAQVIPVVESKHSQEAELLRRISYSGDRWIILAGYMRILSAHFIQQFYDARLGHSRIINIHPSLLPLYPGLNSYRRAFEDPDATESGVTVHLVDEGVDTGPILLQQPFPKLSNDSLATFVDRGMRLEYQLYPEAIRLMNEKVKHYAPISA